MANIIQMGVDQFWRSLKDLEGRARVERAHLDANKLQLQHAWTATRKDTDAARAKQHQAILTPLIHANSAARVDYKSMVAKFNAAVNAAAGVLRSAGLNAPNLSGPELILVPVVAVAALGVAWAIYAKVHDQNVQQSRLIDAAMAIINNPASTPAQRAAAAADIDVMARRKPAGADPFNLDTVLPIVAIIAAIVLVPPLLERLPRPRKVAA